MVSTPSRASSHKRHIAMDDSVPATARRSTRDYDTASSRHSSSEEETEERLKNGDDASDGSCNSSNKSDQQSSANSVGATTIGGGMGEQELAANKLSRQVFWLKVTVLTVLFVAASIVAVSIYMSTRSSERLNFEQVFDDHAVKVLDTFSRNFERKLGVLDFLSVSTTAMAQATPSSEWPFFVVPDFEYRAANARELSDAAMITLLPLVQHQREEWEQFTVTSAHSWLTDAKLFEATTSFRRVEEVAISDAGIPDYRRDEEVVNGVPSKIYSLSEGERVVDPRTAGPFLPMWQHFPVSQSLINYNLYSDPDFQPGLDATLASHDSVLGRIWYLNDEDSIFHEHLSKWIKRGDANKNVAATPLSKIFYPVFEDFAINSSNKEDRKVVAILSSAIDWTTYLLDILPPGANGIIAVLENTCGDVHTFQINGESAVTLGVGDLHDKDFDHQKRSQTLESLLTLEYAQDNSIHHVPLHFDYCPYKLTVYPSSELEDSFLTNKALFYTLAAVLTFIFTTSIFLGYDYLVERRQQVVMKRAIQSRAIVSSLFPAAVQERLFRGTDQSDASEERSYATTIFQWNPFNRKKNVSANAGNSARRRGQTVASNGRMRLTDVIDGTGLENDSKIPIHELKPIADLFPHTTVLFADIAGFTAWSARRKPEHVFTLLQTVYHAFDRVAKRRGVFKVETIGDCYVAVTGLPDPQPDHAVRMVKFANECRKKMTELVEKLKIGLGDDTVELAMRFGLHSGPVTAGVLRGERSRFQLFGNTVNIAARMEQSGARNRIHATQETADLIAGAGYVHWIEQRVVDVADRGGFQTYLIEPHSADTADEPRAAKPAPTTKTITRTKSSAASSGTVTETEAAAATTEGPQRERRQVARGARRFQLDDKEKHLVEWNLDLFKKLLQQIIAHRRASGIEPAEAGHNLASTLLDGANIRSEVSSIIDFPLYNKEESSAKVNPNSIELSDQVVKQLRDFISFVASMHRDNPFHNFTRSSNICVAVNKHLQRIVDDKLLQQVNEPLSKFAILFSALAHGIDHSGVPNEQLVVEKSRIAVLYQNKSVSQQNAIDLAFSALMDTDYAELQSAIFTDKSEVARFRKIVVNCIIATDLHDRELVVDRNKRWLYAFLEQGSPYAGQEKQNLMATVVMEAIIQASHNGHALQYFLSYKLWNERYFRELYGAFKQGRLDEDSSQDWHAKELLFLDESIIPLARKLKESKVLGTAGDDALAYALTNRKEWATKGNGIAEEFLDRFNKGSKK